MIKQELGYNYMNENYVSLITDKMDSSDDVDVNTSKYIKHRTYIYGLSKVLGLKGAKAQRKNP